MAESGAVIGNYTEGNWDALPGEPRDQRKLGSEYRLALKSKISGVLSRHQRVVEFVGGGSEGSFTVYALPPFATAEEASQVAGEIDESWQKQLAKARCGETALAHIDTFHPVQGQGQE